MPLILYSTVSSLAYEINQLYYNGVHYAWCAPARTPDPYVTHNPPSSDPILLYDRYKRDAEDGDLHSDLIDRNRSGIIRGASSRQAQGLISSDERNLIEQMALDAKPSHFTPLMMVIPFKIVEHLVKPVATRDRAGITSQEFLIEDLPRASFDVIKWKS